MTRTQLFKDIKRAVHEQMRESIYDGDERMYMELEYGMALVAIEVHEVRLRNGMLYDDVDVAITHDEMEHKSPLLTQAVREILPNWFDVKYEVEQEIVA